MCDYLQFNEGNATTNYGIRRLKNDWHIVQGIESDRLRPFSKFVYLDRRKWSKYGFEIAMN